MNERPAATELHVIVICRRCERPLEWCACADCTASRQRRRVYLSYCGDCLADLKGGDPED